jgi:hypothetical protein
MKNLKTIEIDGTTISYDLNELTKVVEARIDGFYVKHFPTLREARIHIEKNPRGIKEFYRAGDFASDTWVPACGGLETATMTRRGLLLYCFNHATGKHAWLDLGLDRIIDDREVEAAMY